jgi:hypothetical protein
MGYIRAEVPVKEYSSLVLKPTVETARLDGAVLDLRGSRPPYEDESLDLGHPEEWRRKAEELAATEPLLDLSAEKLGSPLVASSFLGLEDWLSVHPTYDGRGVTVATGESLRDLLDHPSSTRVVARRTAYSKDRQDFRWSVGLRSCKAVEPCRPSPGARPRAFKDLEHCQRNSGSGQFLHCRG